MKLALPLVGLGVKRREHGLELRHHRRRRQNDQALGSGLGCDAENVADIPARILRREHLLGQRRKRIRIPLHFEDSEHSLLVHGVAVQFLNDRLGVLQIGSRSGNDE